MRTAVGPDSPRATGLGRGAKETPADAMEQAGSASQGRGGPLGRRAADPEAVAMQGAGVDLGRPVGQLLGQQPRSGADRAPAARSPPAGRRRHGAGPGRRRSPSAAPPPPRRGRPPTASRRAAGSPWGATRASIRRCDVGGEHGQRGPAQHDPLHVRIPDPGAGCGWRGAPCRSACRAGSGGGGQPAGALNRPALRRGSSPSDPFRSPSDAPPRSRPAAPSTPRAKGPAASQPSPGRCRPTADPSSTNSTVVTSTPRSDAPGPRWRGRRGRRGWIWSPSPTPPC